MAAHQAVLRPDHPAAGAAGRAVGDRPGVTCPGSIPQGAAHHEAPARQPGDANVAEHVLPAGPHQAVLDADRPMATGAGAVGHCAIFLPAGAGRRPVGADHHVIVIAQRHQLQVVHLHVAQPHQAVLRPNHAAAGARPAVAGRAHVRPGVGAGGRHCPTGQDGQVEIPQQAAGAAAHQAVIRRKRPPAAGRFPRRARHPAVAQRPGVGGVPAGRRVGVIPERADHHVIAVGQGQQARGVVHFVAHPVDGAAHGIAAAAAHQAVGRRDRPQAAGRPKGAVGHGTSVAGRAAGSGCVIPGRRDHHVAAFGQQGHAGVDGIVVQPVDHAAQPVAGAAAHQAVARPDRPQAGRRARRAARPAVGHRPGILGRAAGRRGVIPGGGDHDIPAIRQGDQAGRVAAGVSVRVAAQGCVAHLLAAGVGVRVAALGAIAHLLAQLVVGAGAHQAVGGRDRPITAALRAAARHCPGVQVALAGVPVRAAHHEIAVRQHYHAPRPSIAAGRTAGQPADQRQAGPIVQVARPHIRLRPIIETRVADHEVAVGQPGDVAELAAADGSGQRDDLRRGGGGCCRRSCCGHRGCRPRQRQPGKDENNQLSQAQALALPILSFHINLLR